jgi:hypothetical protein
MKFGHRVLPHLCAPPALERLLLVVAEHLDPEGDLDPWLGE